MEGKIEKEGKEQGSMGAGEQGKVSLLPYTHTLLPLWYGSGIGTKGKGAWERA